MALSSPFTVDTTLLQDGQAPGSITPADIRIMNDSLAGVFITTVSVSTYTIGLIDQGTLLEFSGSGQTLLIPTDASVAFPNGTVVGWCWSGSGTALAIAAVTPGTTTVTNASSAAARVTNSEGSVRKRSTNNWNIRGDVL